MIAVQLGQTSSTSSLAGQCMCLHADDLRSSMNGQQHRVDRQKSSRKKRLSAISWTVWRTHAPLESLPVGHPYS